MNRFAQVASLLLLTILPRLAAQEVSQSGLELKAARPLVQQAERAPKAMIASAHELAAGLERRASRRTRAGLLTVVD